MVEPRGSPTFLEQFYRRQALHHTRIKTNTLPQALATLMLKKIINSDTAKKVLHEHAGELLEREPMNFFTRIHEAVTQSRRKKIMDELHLKYSLALANRNAWNPE